MINEVNNVEYKNYYLKQFELYDGEYFITFNIVDINTEKQAVHCAVTNRGKISLIEFELKRDKENQLYFEFGVDKNKVKIEDFED